MLLLNYLGGHFYMARVSTKSPGAAIAASLKKLRATVEKLSEAAGVPVTKINAILNKGETVTPELSVKLSKALGEKDRYLADLQLGLDITAAAKKVGKIAKLRKPPAGKPGRKPGVKKADAPADKSADSPANKPGRKPGPKSAVAEQTTERKRGRKPGPKPKV
jgi:addiction module HigA family antidote